MFIIALNEEECLLIITANFVHGVFPGTLNNMHIHVLVWNVSFPLKPTVYCFAMHFGEVLLVWNFHSLGFWVGCISTHYLNLRVRLLTDVNIQRWSSSLSGKQQVYFSASMVTKQGWEIMIHPSFTKQNVGMQPPVSSFLSIYFLLDLLRVYTCEPLIWIALVHIFTQRLYLITIRKVILSYIHRSGHKWWQPPISSSISIYFLLDLWRVYTCKPIIEFPYELSLSICSHTDCVDHYNISLEKLHPPKLYVLINFYVV